jgi:class 3 adenylate cyclase
MMIKKIFLLLLILCLEFEAQSQIKTLERLSKEFSITLDDKKKVLLMSDIGYYYRLSNIDTAFLLSHKALALAKKLSYYEGEANALSTIGSIYRMTGDIQKAMLNQYECLSIAKKYGYTNELAKAYLAIGIVYSDIKDYNLAIHYIKLSNSLYKTLNKPTLLNTNIANLGEVYFKNNQLDSALYYLQIAHKNLLKDVDRSPVLPFTFSRLSMVHLKLKNYNLAYGFAHKAIELGKDDKNMRVQIKGYQILSEYYQSLGKIDSAIIFAQTAYDIASTYNYKLDILENSNLLASLYENKDLKKAFDYTKNSIQLNDSLYGVKKVNALQKKILEEQNIMRENEARLLESRNRTKLNALLFCLVFVGFIGLILYRNNIQKQKANTLLQKQKEEIEQERQKSDNLLLNILPEETAQELKETGIATPKHYDLVSVLFTDFKGFSQIAEKLSPQAVIENLNTCFLALDEICERHNLEKIKTIGDSYMCAGGIPVANTSNPMDCVQAGLEMQAWMAHWKAEKEAKGELAWELRLGIHSGPVVAGVIGKNKFAYDIWGDAVNLASRMESGGEAGKVNISGATYELVKDKFQCTYRGKIEAKNKGEVEMYFVESAL